jgi:hypothetical protein
VMVVAAGEIRIGVIGSECQLKKARLSINSQITYHSIQDTHSILPAPLHQPLL